MIDWLEHWLESTVTTGSDALRLLWRTRSLPAGLRSWCKHVTSSYVGFSSNVLTKELICVSGSEERTYEYLLIFTSLHGCKTPHGSHWDPHEAVSSLLLWLFWLFVWWIVSILGSFVCSGPQTFSANWKYPFISVAFLLVFRDVSTIFPLTCVLFFSMVCVFLTWTRCICLMSPEKLYFCTRF